MRSGRSPNASVVVLTTHSRTERRLPAGGALVDSFESEFDVCSAVRRVVRAGLVDLRLNALRARDRGSYLLHMERYTRAGEQLFTLQVSIGVQVLGVRASASASAHLCSSRSCSPILSYPLLSSPLLSSPLLYYCTQSRPQHCTWRTART